MSCRHRKRNTNILGLGGNLFFFFFFLCIIDGSLLCPSGTVLVTEVRGGTSQVAQARRMHTAGVQITAKPRSSCHGANQEAQRGLKAATRVHVSTGTGQGQVQTSQRLCWLHEALVGRKKSPFGP